MEAVRGSRSLAALLRLGVAAVVLAAFVADWWISGARGWIGGSLTSYLGTRPGAVMLVVAGITVCAWAWALWPHLTPWAAAAASIGSLLVTANVSDRPRFPLFTEFAVLPVLLGAALWRPTAWRWPIAVLVVVAGEAIALRAGSDGGVRNVLALSMFVLFGAAVTVVVYARLKDYERRAGIALARRSERLELARELHDVVGHHVTGIVVLAQASRFAAATGDGAARRDTDRTLADIERAGLETLTSVRRLVGLLRDDAPTTAGPGLADIEQLVADLRATHPQAALAADEAIRSAWVPADLATTVHRLVQEATTNIRKHGDPDGPVTVALRRGDGSIDVEVQNRRRPGSVGTGYGLVGMGERVRALGGTFAAGPAGERVWIVHASLPLVGVA